MFQNLLNGNQIIVIFAAQCNVSIHDIQASTAVWPGRSEQVAILILSPIDTLGSMLLVLLASLRGGLTSMLGLKVDWAQRTLGWLKPESPKDFFHKSEFQKKKTRNPKRIVRTAYKVLAQHVIEKGTAFNFLRMEYLFLMKVEKLLREEQSSILEARYRQIRSEQQLVSGVWEKCCYQSCPNSPEENTPFCSKCSMKKECELTLYRLGFPVNQPELSLHGRKKCVRKMNILTQKVKATVK